MGVDPHLYTCIDCAEGYWEFLSPEYPCDIFLQDDWFGSLREGLEELGPEMLNPLMRDKFRRNEEIRHKLEATGERVIRLNSHFLGVPQPMLDAQCTLMTEIRAQIRESKEVEMWVRSFSEEVKLDMCPVVDLVQLNPQSGRETSSRKLRNFTRQRKAVDMDEDAPLELQYFYPIWSLSDGGGEGQDFCLLIRNHELVVLNLSPQPLFVYEGDGQLVLALEANKVEPLRQRLISRTHPRPETKTSLKYPVFQARLNMEVLEARAAMGRPDRASDKRIIEQMEAEVQELKTVVLQSLPYDATRPQILGLFPDAKKIVFPGDRFAQDRQQTAEKGFVFLTFGSREEALKHVYSPDPPTLGGRSLRIKLKRPMKDSRENSPVR